MPRATRYAALAAALLSGCGGHPRAAPPAAGGETLAFAVARLEPVPLERRLDGVVEPVEQATIAAQTSGRVEALAYDVGQVVPAGAVIVRVRSVSQRAGVLQAQAAVRAAAARATEAQAHYRRVAGLYAHGVLPKATFDQATAARDTAVARLGSARAALQSARENLGYTAVRAPYTGIVARRLVQVGEAVAPGTPLLIVYSLQHLRVALDLPASIAPAVRRLGQAAVYVAGRRIEVEKVTVFPEASAASDTFHARLELPANFSGLYPGMRVRTGMVLGEIERLLVPASAVFERGEVTAVYVLEPRKAAGGAQAQRIEMRQVRVGRHLGARVEILAGLSAGERVALAPLAALERLEQARAP